MKLLYVHVGLKDVGPGLHCLHALQQLTPWPLTPEITADKALLEAHKTGMNAEPERKKRTYFYFGWQARFQNASRWRLITEATLWQSQPYFTVTGVCITHMWQRMLSPHQWPGEMHTSAEMRGLTLVSALVCRSQEPGCQGESLAIRILSDTELQTRIWSRFADHFWKSTPQAQLLSWARTLLTLASPEKAVKSPNSSHERFKKKPKNIYCYFHVIWNQPSTYFIHKIGTVKLRTRKIYVAFFLHYQYIFTHLIRSNKRK